MQIEYSLDQIDKAAAEFWQLARKYKVWALTGGLGAGKTTFVSAICRYLGADTAASSPTFSLVNEYHFFDPHGKEVVIFHSDWYRLKDETEAIDAGMEDMLASDNAYCIVEWPERAPGLLSQDVLQVSFSMMSEPRRVLHFSAQEM